MMEMENENKEMAPETEAPEAETSSKRKCKKKDGAEPCREDKKLEKLLEEKDKAIEEAKTAFSELNDRYLRLMAEFENYKKRTQSEKDAIYGSAVCDSAEQILPVLDNLERSLVAAEGDTSPICEGVRMIERQFKDSLAKLGVTEIPALGEQFDPNLHNAIMHEENEEKGENEIVEVFQKGYILGDKVVRHSMVKVAN